MCAEEKNDQNDKDAIEPNVIKTASEPAANSKAPAPAEASGEEVIEDVEMISDPEEKAKPKDASNSFKTHVSEGVHKAAKMSQKAAEVTGDVLSSSYDKVKDYDPKTSIHILDRFLNWARKICPPDMFDRISEWCAKYGHAGIVLAQILTLVFFVVASIRNTWKLLFYGIGIALLLVVLQYTAEKFLNAGKRFIASTPSRLSSPAFLDCSALILEISGLLIFLYMATSGWINALLGLAIWSLLEAIALTAIHPELVNVTIEGEVNAGEEAVGIMSFFAKSMLKIVPIAYGVGAIFGAIAMLLAVFSLFRDGMQISSGVKAIYLIVTFACLPLLSYVIFVLYHLLIDILQSILSLPGKINIRNDQQSRK